MIPDEIKEIFKEFWHMPGAKLAFCIILMLIGFAIGAAIFGKL